MERHFLATVSDDLTALAGLRFLNTFFTDKTGMRITLFYTASQPAALWGSERNWETVKRSQEKVEEVEARGREALGSAERFLEEGGFPPGSVVQKFNAGGFSKIRDIVREGEQGLYDAVVLGRRALRRLDELLDESVSKAMLMEDPEFPLWICRMPEPSRKNVLVCVDRSRQAHHAADHVGFILNDKGVHDAVLCTVVEPGGDTAAAGEVLLANMEYLTAYGFPADRVSSKVLTGRSPAKAIMAEADAGRYAVVAVGRTGQGQGLVSRLFFGSVSLELYKELQGAVLWVCK